MLYNYATMFQIQNLIVMKSSAILLIILFTIFFSSCNLNSSSNSTPQILMVTQPQLNSKDSIFTYITDMASVYQLDSINVGDTVTFRILLNGITNHLISYYITLSDTTSTKLLLPKKNSLDSVFNSSLSNYSIGKFIFKSDIINLYFPFKYVAIKQSIDSRITFTLVSDASFDGGTLNNNSVSLVIRTPIRKPKLIIPISK